MSLIRRAMSASTLAVLLLAAPTHAQLVTPRTVPVFQNEQFAVYPSSRPAIPLSLAFDDTLSDPFGNPAKARRIRTTTISTAPYSHSISDNGGGGQTFPLSLFATRGDWSGGVHAATQQLDRGGWRWNLPTSQQSVNNQYLTALVARGFSDGLSVGASISRADLRGIDGVDLLYAGSDNIVQGGTMNDYRIGATKEFAPGHVLEVVGLHNRTSMRHDVHFTINTWNPTTRINTVTQRDEVNLDQTNIWGLHSEYAVPVGVEGWTLAAVGTANRLSHPKIPNYVLQNLPRDPGNTNAYNIGVGATKVSGGTTFGINYIIEPMSSDTWADAATPSTRADGSVIPAGAKTVENHFVFRNRKVALGFGHTWRGKEPGEGITADFGLTMYHIDYELTQTNNILRTVRNQHENWSETGPSFGLRYKSRDFEIAYAFRANCGTRGCDIAIGGESDRVVAATANSSTIIAAPSSQLFLQSGMESSNRLVISLPIR